MAEQAQTKPEEKKPEEKGLRVKNTPAFKLKDRPNRQFVFINFKKQFGFIPEVIIVEKIRGKNNGLVVRAILTEAEIKSEDARLAFIEETKKRELARSKQQLEVDKQKLNGKSESSTPETTKA